MTATLSIVRSSDDVGVERAPASSPPARLSSRPAAIVAVGVAVLPLIVDGGGWYPFVAVRWAVIATLTCAGLVMLAVTRRVRRLAGSRWWLALIGVAVVSALTSGAPWVSLFGSNDRRLGAATWVLHGATALIGAGIGRTRRDLRVVARGVSVASLLTTTIAAGQSAGWRFPSSVALGARLGGPFGNADFLGAFAALALLVAVGAALDREERERWRLVHLLAAIGAAFCLAVSGSRGAWVGVLVGLVVLAVIASRRAGVSARRAVGAVAVVALAVSSFLLLAGLGPRIASAASGAGGRVATWERAALVVGERPVLGWGPEGFAAGFGRAADARWERTYGRRLLPDRAHNGLLDVAATMGFVGLIAYGGVLVATGRSIRRRMVAEPRVPSFTMIGVVAALCAYLSQQQSLFQLFDVDALAWLLAGAVSAMAVGVAPAAPRKFRWSVDRTAGVGAVVLAAVALIAWSGASADRAARRSVDLLAAGHAGTAEVAARTALDRDPQTLYALVLADTALADASPRALTAARARLETLGSFDDGRVTLARSRMARALGTTRALGASRAEVVALLDRDPARSEAWAELGEVLLRLDDWAGAQRAFSSALDLRPQRNDLWVRLAFAADRAGDRGEERDAIAHVDPAGMDAAALALRDRILG